MKKKMKRNKKNNERKNLKREMNKQVLRLHRTSMIIVGTSTINNGHSNQRRMASATSMEEEIKEGDV